MYNEADRFDNSCRHRADDRHQEHVSSCQCGKFGVDGACGHREAGDDDGELTAGDQSGTGARLTHSRDTLTSGRPSAGYQLRDRRDHCQDRGPSEDWRNGTGIGVETEDHEEHCGEQISKGLEHATGIVRRRPRDRDSEEECAHSRRHLHRRTDAGDQQCGTEQLEQERLTVGTVEEGGDVPSVSEGHDKKPR